MKSESTSSRYETAKFAYRQMPQCLQQTETAILPMPQYDKDGLLKSFI